MHIEIDRQSDQDGLDRLAARLTVVGSVTEVPPVVTALARTMEKIHRDRDIAIEVDAPEHARFRGERLDETKPGSGLGLSIVIELARLYGGGLTLGTAPIGGLRAELVLPAG